MSDPEVETRGCQTPEACSAAAIIETQRKALVLAECALAIQGSYRAPEQARIQAALDVVRRSINQRIVPYDGVANKQQYDAEAAHAEMAAEYGQP